MRLLPEHDPPRGDVLRSAPDGGSEVLLCVRREGEIGMKCYLLIKGGVVMMDFDRLEDALTWLEMEKETPGRALGMPYIVQAWR